MKKTQLAAAVLLATGSASALAATYEITPLPVEDISQNNFASSIDNTGAMLTSVGEEFSPRLDVELLEETGFFTAIESALDAPDDARAGVFTTDDYNTIVANLATVRSTRSKTNVQLTDFRSYVTDLTDAELVPALDVISEGDDDYTWSVRGIARDSLSRDFIVGDGELPFLPLVYTNDDGDDTTYILSAGIQQAFAYVNGNAVRLPSPDDTLNGYAAAYAVNSNFEVGGYASTAYTDDFMDSVEACQDDENRTIEPEERCLATLAYSSTTSSFSSTQLNNATLSPVVWQLNASGEVVNTVVYPLVFEADDDTNSFFKRGRVQDINDAGVGVGYSAIEEQVLLTSRTATGSSTTTTRPARTVATSFIDGETTELLDRDENQLSQASAINDNGWVTGTVTRSPNSIAREFLFAHNLETGETMYPEGFFSNAETIGQAINNSNTIVGNSQVQATQSSVTKTHGFMYTVGEDDSIIDLNTLTSCDSPYEIVDAVDINDNGEIIANAIIEKAVRNIDGTTAINDAGEEELEEVVVAVKLTPNANGQIEQCDADDVGSDEDEGFERSGAAFGPWWIALLAGLVGFRRFCRS